MISEFDMDVPATVETLKQARQAVEQSVRTQAIDVDEEVIEKLRLVLNEVLSNAIAAHHASGAGDQSVSMHWTVGDHAIEVSVFDHGGGFDLDGAYERRDMTEPDRQLREGGFGLDVIREFADEAQWFPAPDGTSVWFRIKCPSPSAV